MQAVILAGGLATRLRPLTQQTPKCMIKIQEKPFLQYQLELLAKNDITEVVLCLGHLARQVEEFFGDGSKWRVRLTYSIEDEKLLGTAGALRNAIKYLQPQFLVIYGDSYLDFPYSDIIEEFHRSKPEVLLAVFKNFNRWDKSNLVVENGWAKIYNKKVSSSGMEYIDAGLSIFSKEIVEEIPDGQFYDLADLYQTLAFQKRLKVYELKKRFYEVGSSKGLKEFAGMVERGVLIR